MALKAYEQILVKKSVGSVNKSAVYLSKPTPGDISLISYGVPNDSLLVGSPTHMSIKQNDILMRP